MQVVDVVARAAHYIDHIAPIWAALPSQYRGQFCTTPKLLDYAKQKGVDRPSAGLPRTQSPVLVASHGDMVAVRGRPIIFMEHGVGQSYNRQHQSYAGSPDRADVVLFLNPSEHVARLNAVHFPDVPSVNIGCPKLDQWHLEKPKRHRPPTVATSFHWNCHVAPESRGAFAYYREALASLAASRFRVLGHAHPRIWNEIAPLYQRLGIELVPDFADVLDRADIYVCDNSSTLYEFASTRRPVVVLNAPWYRRDVEHGLRFWEYADVGVQVNRPDELLAGIEEAVKDSPAQRRRRDQISHALYGPCDGHAADRAAQAIEALAVQERPAQPGRLRWVWRDTEQGRRAFQEPVTA